MEREVVRYRTLTENKTGIRVTPRGIDAQKTAL
jgi:hypothetical protein